MTGEPVPQFMNFHQDLVLPAEAIAQIVELQAASAAPARPFLLLSVLAPAEARSALKARTLYSSQDPRPAGLTEERLIATPAATLTSAGVLVPPDPSLATEPEQAQAVVETMKQAPEYRAALTGQARTLAAQLVKGARVRPLAVPGSGPVGRSQRRRPGRPAGAQAEP
jgi:hypothetical protein